MASTQAAGIAESLRQFRQWLDDMADPRTKDWFLCGGPETILVIWLIYLVGVIAGPRLMRDRPAMNLRGVALVYNFVLVLLSVYMAHEFFWSAWLAGYNLACDPVDYSDSPLAMRMASVCWWFYVSKVIELMDTVLIVLRKKNEQLSFLHIYHHATMILLWWSGARYVPGGHSFFCALLNSSVHVFMYLYYFLALLGPHMRKYLWWKRYLTQMQLLQFLLFSVHSFVNIMQPNCGFPRGYSISVVIYGISLMLLFGNFYRNAYKRTSGARKVAD
ncbi:hypothetical protein BOX15_Mlig007849g1 [Macrostomum lignano]|uniref:Elongation of very long chain fatty acids protein n=1 Tax=Macrostomum lignano TaxID=282301 RepID=A0A267GJJ6_9PLAT|nr:hypothetical protein BOX15_Mlig007849g1 [Macrostomum lignano]